MKFIRSILPILALLLTSMLLLTACASELQYKTDVPAEEITKAIAKEIPIESSYHPQDSDFMQFYLTDAVPVVYDYSIVSASASDDYTEIGVLFVKNADDLPVVETAVQSYLDYFRETYTPQAEQYDPSEMQKLKDASYRVYGNYVVYTIMSAEDQSTCDRTVKSALVIPEE